MPDRKPKILLLDDDRLTLELYARELAGDYQVTRTDDVSDTRQQLKDQVFDVVIIEPAVAGGWQLINEIHALKKSPLVILCSVDDEWKSMIDKDVDTFLVKPVLPETLHTLLDQIFTKKSTQSFTRLERGV
ncbi:MAG TPA: response regulator [Anaerolineaceae bacterium]